MKDKTNYVKSPLNYVGGKFKLLPQILPLFPQNINVFVDLFGGGANVAANINANTIIYNDINLKVVQILKTFKKTGTDILLDTINTFIESYHLDKTNREGFLALRDKYNKSENKDPIMLYTIICYAFNYQIRFNSKGEYNMPFGKDRSSFNDTLKQKFIKFCDEIHNKNIFFTNSDFREYKEVEMCASDFVYCDPPYFNSTAAYNENGGWTAKDEYDLYNFLNCLSQKKIRWALSNDLAVNTLACAFAKEMGYNIHYLDANYGNCNYHKKDRSKGKEVLITNY